MARSPAWTPATAPAAAEPALTPAGRRLLEEQRAGLATLHRQLAHMAKRHRELTNTYRSLLHATGLPEHALNRQGFVYPAPVAWRVAPVLPQSRLPRRMD